jgi:hypothetical protein
MNVDPAHAAAPSFDFSALQAILQQQHQQQQQAQQQLIDSMLQHQQQQLAALHQQHQQAMQHQSMQQQAPAATGATDAARLLALSSLGQLRTFAGRADASGLAAREWLTHAEHYFAARELAVGASALQGDTHRVLAARNALTDDALRWLSALPQPPSTWQTFRDAFLQRFSSVPAVQVREAQLHRFVEAARRIRDRLTVEGMQRYTTLFLERAGEIPAERMTEATKRTLYAQGLPPRYAEVVLIEDAKATPPALHAVAQTVLAKATLKAHAASSAGSGPFAPNASSASAGPAYTPDAMDVDAIALCAAQFGIPRAEASAYFDGTEGWAPHDTATPAPMPRNPASVPPSAVAAPAALGAQQIEQLLAAFDARHADRGANGGKAPSHRRNVPEGVRAVIPDELARARKSAGVCVRCGVAKYEPGAYGHNASTCKAPANLTTRPAAPGKKNTDF